MSSISCCYTQQFGTSLLADAPTVGTVRTYISPERGASMNTSTLEVIEPDLAREPLTLSDRCDSCAAQAFVAAIMTTGLELLFCGHHYRKNEAALVSQGARVHDERERINAKPSVSGIVE
jgi:N-acetylmuramic acid 6-phosphate (MurNAc-6-P) etherase